MCGMSPRQHPTDQVCPECGSDQVTDEPYDFGRCGETGYNDAGERYRCLTCGAQGDVDDMHGALIALGRTSPPEGEVLIFQGPGTHARAAGWNAAQSA